MRKTAILIAVACSALSLSLSADANMFHKLFLRNSADNYCSGMLGHWSGSVQAKVKILFSKVTCNYNVDATVSSENAGQNFELDGHLTRAAGSNTTWCQTPINEEVAGTCNNSTREIHAADSFFDFDAMGVDFDSGIMDYAGPMQIDYQGIKVNADVVVKVKKS